MPKESFYRMDDLSLSAPTIQTSSAEYECEGIRHITVDSAALHGRGDVSLWIPEATSLTASTPIVLLLHGVYGSHWSWFYQGGAHRIVSRLVNQGKIRPMILVCPSDGLAGQGSGYLPMPKRNVEEWICEMPQVTRLIVPSCDLEVPLIFIAGLSMGGYGALRIGANRAPLFAGISAHSPITRLAQYRLFFQSSQSFIEDAPGDGEILSHLRKNFLNLPPIRFDCGRDDDLFTDTQALHLAMQKLDIPHCWEPLRGDHSWAYWKANLHRSLSFFESICAVRSGSQASAASSGDLQ